MALTRKFTSEQRRERALRVLPRLAKAYPDAECALNHRSALELLIATILSAQCTDERVNVVTRDLFAKYCEPRDYVRIPREVLEADIRSTGFYRNKAKSIQGACNMILERYHGKVPETMEELIQLPGVARKTANVVLGVVYGKTDGIVVDTHVHRVSQRLELSYEDAPEKIERDLMSLIPRGQWIAFSFQMISHGRRLCKARKPVCCECPVQDFCRSGDKAPPPLPRGAAGGLLHKRGRKS